MRHLLEKHWAWALFLVALGVRLAGAGAPPIAHDEPFTLYWSLRPWQEFLAMLRTENNPPLHFLVMRAWVQLVPLEPFWLRFPSVLFGAAAAVPLARMALRWAGPWAAASAAALFLFNGLHHGLAHEVRGYSLFTLLTVLAFDRFTRMAFLEQRSMHWLVVLYVLLVYNHFFGWLVVGLHSVMALLPLFRAARAAQLRALLWTVVAYLPYAGILVTRTTESISKGTWLEAPAPEEVYNMLWRWSGTPVLTVALLAVILASVVRTRIPKQALTTCLLWTFVPLLGMFLVSFIVPVFLDRYLVFAAPGWAILAGLSIASWGHRSSIAGTALLWVALLSSFRPFDAGPNTPDLVPEAVHAMQRDAPCAEVAVVPPWYRLTYRWHEAGRPFSEDPPSDLFDHVLLEGTPEVCGVIVVDADAPDDHSAQFLNALRQGYLCTDSVEASYKVWVKRFVPRI